MINWASSDLDILIWDVGHGLSVTAFSPFVAVADGQLPIERRRVIQVDAGINSTYEFSPFYHITRRGWTKQIDCLVLSHPDKDHIDDLKYLDWIKQNLGLEILTLLRNKTIPSEEISEDKTIESQAKTVYRRLSSEYTGQAKPHQLLSPTNYGGISFQYGMLDYSEELGENNSSVVLSLEYGITQILIPGDIEAMGVEQLIALGKMPKPKQNAVRILVAPHHGSETADPSSLLRYFKPDLVLASAEKEHAYTDSIYSSPSYVAGYSIITSGGITQEARFSSTKGETIHIKINTSSLPTVRRFDHRTY